MMRIVQYEKNTRTAAYRALWALAIVAAAFSLVVIAFLVANNVRLQSADPIHSPALQRLIVELKSSPQNEALKEQIRELDWLARRAYFTSQRFNQVAVWLLVGGVGIAIVSFKTLAAYHRKTPYPDGQDRRDDLAANARWARQSITVVGLVLIGLALSLALPWKSLLDRPPAEWTAPSPTAGKAPNPATRGGSTPPPILTKALPTAATSNSNGALVSANVPAGPAAMPAASAPAPASREERKQHWPSFRGPASGRSPAEKLPTQWDGGSGTGVVWKTSLPLPGFGSPIVWHDQIFLSGANEKRRAVYALDAREGRLLWERPVPADGAPSGPAPEVMADTGQAAPTMTTDGARVFAIFATGDLAAFDLAGVPVWSQRLGTPINPYGHSSSLEIFEDLVLVQYDQKTNGFVAAFDVRTGATRWRVPRTTGASWASPAFAEADGHTELVLVADAFVTGLDPRSGRELWRVKALASGDVAPSPVCAHGRVYVAADHVKFVAIDLQTHAVVWENKQTTPGVGTPVVSGDWIFAGLSEGSVACWDARSGQVKWTHETDDGFYSSPITAGDRVYAMDRTGRMFIFKADGGAFQSVAQPVLGEESVATPAVYGDSLIIRGTKNLYRIGAARPLSP